MTKLLARLLNQLPPYFCYLFPRAVVTEAVYLVAAEVQAYKLEKQINPY